MVSSTRNRQVSIAISYRTNDFGSSKTMKITSFIEISLVSLQMNPERYKGARNQFRQNLFLRSNVSVVLPTDISSIISLQDSMGRLDFPTSCRLMLTRSVIAFIAFSAFSPAAPASLIGHEIQFETNEVHKHTRIHKIEREREYFLRDTTLRVIPGRHSA